MVPAGSAAGFGFVGDHYIIEHIIFLTNNCFHVQKIKRSAICHWPVLFNSICNLIAKCNAEQQCSCKTEYHYRFKLPGVWGIDDVY